MTASMGPVGGLYAWQHHSADVARYAYAPKLATTTYAAWKEGGWRSLPAARSELGGDIEEPFLVQWVGSAPEITATLVASGWRTAPPWSLKSLLLWLLPSAKIEELPVFPRFNHGQPQRLDLVKDIDPERRLVVRLWDARTEVISSPGGSARSLWYGTATAERVSHAKGLATFVDTLPDGPAALRALSEDIRKQNLSIASEARGPHIVELIWEPR